VEIDEGGSNSPVKEPGKTKYAPLTLTHGVTDNEELYQWAKAVALDGEDAVKNLSIVQTDRAGTETRRWNVFAGWPSKFKAGDWDSKASEAVIEELEITYNYFEKG
jgi:phage tail-like protein